MASLIRSHYDPVAEFECLFDDAFNARFRLPTSSAQAAKCPVAQRLDSFRPKLDIHESTDSNTMTATFELPGLQSEDIAVDIHHNRLTVSGESTTSNSHEEGAHTIRDRHYGKFSRTLQLPLGTKPEDVKAQMRNGLLTLKFPKAASEQLPQRITIQ